MYFNLVILLVAVLAGSGHAAPAGSAEAVHALHRRSSYHIVLCPDAERHQGAQTSCTAYLDEPTGGCQNLPGAIIGQVSSLAHTEGLACTFWAGHDCTGDSIVSAAATVFNLEDQGFNDRAVSFKCG